MMKDKGKEQKAMTVEAMIEPAHACAEEQRDAVYQSLSAVPPLDRRPEAVGTAPVVSFVDAGGTMTVIRDCTYSVGAKGPDGRPLLNAAGKRVKATEKRVRLIVTVPRTWLGQDEDGVRALLRLVSAQVSILPRKSVAWATEDTWEVSPETLLALSRPSGKRTEKTPEEREQISRRTRETTTAKTLAAAYGIPEDTVRELLSSGGIRAVVDYVAKL